jgi:adenosylmethionine-8-amino-7-oxononanoate aminotransferase
MDELGLLCRLDDRGEPVIQLSPPLVTDAKALDRMVSIVGEATDRAQKSWNKERARLLKTAGRQSNINVA